jgi:hypothetical protein
MDSLFLALAIIVGASGTVTSGTISGTAPASPAAAPVVQTLRDVIANPAQSASLKTPLRLERAVVAQRLQPPTFRPHHLKSRKAQQALMGAVIGLFGGAGVGYLMTNDPDCDMCGLPGIMLGAPIGAVIGAIVAVR